MNDNNYTPERRKRPRPTQGPQGGRRADDYGEASGHYYDGYDSQGSRQRNVRRTSASGSENYRYENYQGGQSGRNQQRTNQSRQNQQRRMPNDDYQRNPKKKKNRHTFGKILAIIQAILSLIVLGVLFILNVLPETYLIMIAVVLVILWVFSFFSQFTRMSHIPGKIESIIVTLILALGSYYLLITQNMLSQITDIGYTVDNIVVLVLKDDPAQSLQDAAGYTFGIQKSFNSEKIDKAVKSFGDEAGQQLNVVSYDSLQTQIQALYDGNVGAIIYNEGFKDSVAEIYPTFEQDTRKLDNIEIKTEVETEVSSSDVDVTEEAFSVYISGNDSYGSVDVQGRSDVNIIIFVNPVTKQILQVSTPRDFYVAFPNVTGETKDKLTHSGNFGIQCSMDTMESIYGTEIDYYARVNFTSLIKMVDALGGIDVDADYAFNTFDGKSFVQGINHLNGEDALSFSRERYSLPNGDFDRGRHQQLVIEAMMQKAMSPAILTSYAGIMSSLQDSFVTSMPSSDITSLVKLMLKDGSGWNMVKANAGGTGAMNYCYSLGTTASVVVPDEVSVEQIKAQIKALYNGEILIQQ